MVWMRHVSQVGKVIFLVVKVMPLRSSTLAVDSSAEPLRFCIYSLRSDSRMPKMAASLTICRKLSPLRDISRAAGRRGKGASIIVRDGDATTFFAVGAV